MAGLLSQTCKSHDGPAIAVGGFGIVSEDSRMRSLDQSEPQSAIDADGSKMEGAGLTGFR